MTDQLSAHNVNSDDDIRFCVTGSAAHARLVPLLPSNWTDHSPYARREDHSTILEATNTPKLEFLWENAPRHETKQLRDDVKVYSHLPNGTQVLDSKWVLARLLGNDAVTKNNNDLLLAVLMTHCFKGRSGFEDFCREIRLLEPATFDFKDETTNLAATITHFRDLVKTYDVQETPRASLPQRPSLWVVKDAMANGAGGIWIVGPENASTMLDDATSPLIEGHSYIAQEYAWPPVLFQGRKCHVRVYACMASDGRAFVHERCFLHVANEIFTAKAKESETCSNAVFDDSVHITNCCANSHDPAKFAGEICASLTASEWRHTSCEGEPQQIVPLREFAPSIYASVRALAERTFPFLQGGQANNGFEYLGLDFILSYSRDNLPLAYMLEVNAPPSQDTATELPHADDLHDTVICDWMSLWVLPKITGAMEVAGGWVCVYQDNEVRSASINMPPSKAALVNKIRWTIYERKTAKQDYQRKAEWRRMTEDLTFAIRKHFPFFNSVDKVFLESAGGAQVPHLVIDSMAQALGSRHRAYIGARAKAAASDTMLRILGASPDKFSLHFGANATSLLSRLAQEYVRTGRLMKDDEIVISTENHLANIKPWIEAAQAVGAVVKWYHVVPSQSPESSHSRIEEIINERTRLVLLCHASNILGEVRDICGLKQTINRMSKGNAAVVVDGVAAVPHIFADLDSMNVDWYVVSCHKIFGPHLGALIGRKNIAGGMELELGTVNFEACAGIAGLGQYFAKLSCIKSGEEGLDVVTPSLDQSNVKLAYRLISLAEAPISELLLDWLSKCSNVTLLQSECARTSNRIPVFSFRHLSVSSRKIIASCEECGVIGRRGTFLSCKLFQDDYAINEEDGVVRLSLAHYSVPAEIQRAIKVLEAIPGW
ncbi:hypothetical protein MPSEU_000273100 [Mayamaea pseudoterrestris]|nr:hypothetical protein MPSEU_000273100 [Mayamaea pseudoterrestris]